MSAALFLDRDGVINVDHGYVHTHEKTEFVPGIFPLVAEANANGMKVVIVTNQAGIARGYYSEKQFRDYMDWVGAQFRAHGARIDAVYHCPHHPDFFPDGGAKYCICRKPAPGMLLQASKDMGIDLAESVLIGDNLTDIAAGRAAGIKKLMLLNRQGIAGNHSDSYLIFDELAAARRQLAVWSGVAG